MQALTIGEHEAIRAQIAPGRNEGLMEYADRAGRAKAAIADALQERFPWSVVSSTLGNGRYVVHVEAVLELGGEVEPASLAAIPAGAIRYDAVCFPRLSALRPDLAH